MRTIIQTALAAAFLLAAGPPAAAGLRAGENHPDARWRSLATERFRVIFPARQERIARRVLAAAEEGLPAAARLAGGGPPRRIDIRTTAWDDLSGGRAYQTWPRIELEIYPLDREPERDGFLRQVTLHELTHICHYFAVEGGVLQPILTPAAFANLPDWWVEGVPSAAEKPAPEAREQDLVRVIARSGELPRLRRLDDVDQGDHLDNLLIYRIGEGKVRWFLRRYGPDAAARVNRAMRPPRWSFDGALRRTVGAGEREIHDAWERELIGAASHPAGEAAERIPLPRSIERPLGFAFSPAGDLAVAAVRDEDAWRTELYLRRAGEERVRLIDGEPVGAGLSWSPEGRILAYSRRVPGPANEPRSDLFLHDAARGETRRLTEDARAREPVWIDGDRIAALSFDDSAGASLLLLVDPRTGEADRISLPEEVGSPDRIAAGPGGTVVLNGSAPGRGRELWIYDPRGEPGRAFRRTGPAGAIPYEPFPAGGPGGEILFLDYRSGSPRIKPIRKAAGEGTVREGGIAAPLRVRRVSAGPEGGIWGVVSRGRYRSAIEKIDGGRAASAGAGDEKRERGGAIPGEGNRPRSPDRFGPSRPFHPIAAIRPRPEGAIESIGSEAVSFRVEDLLADPTDTHRLHLEGRLRWDGALREGTLLQEIRAFTPTIRAGGEWGEERRAGGREERYGGSIGLSLPFRFTSWSTAYALEGSLARILRRRTAGGASETEGETLLRAGFTRRAAFPRRGSLLALRWERECAGGGASAERWEAEAAWTHALFRSDAFLGVDGAAAVESGERKRPSILYPAGIERPVRAVAGTRTASWGVFFSYPWSEDLGAAAGPFYLERLTHILRYREGAAGNEGEDGVDRVRAAATELRLRLFSGLFLPFAGARTVDFTAGAAREIGEKAETEWYFALSGDFWSERWTAER